jgi:hypothetical protein
MSSQNFVRKVGYLGAAANWLIPIAAITNLYNQPAANVNPQMTGILAVYSCVFMRWAIAISPPNYPLLACHIANSTAQVATLGKYYLLAGNPSK